MARFPELTTPLPVSEQTIAGAAALGFQKQPCPLCSSHSAAARGIDGQEASWWICSTCQRFSLTTPAQSTLRRMHDTRHPRYGRHRTGLSRFCARSNKPVVIDEQNMQQVGDAGLLLDL